MKDKQEAEVERVKYMPDRFPTEAIRAALVQAKGMITIAARIVGCTTDTIYRRMENYPELRQLCENFRAEFVDTAELKLHSAVIQGESWAIRYTLDTIGKHRGYGGAGPNDQLAPADADQWIGVVLTDDELDQRIKDTETRILAIEGGTPPPGGPGESV